MPPQESDRVRDERGHVVVLRGLARDTTRRDLTDAVLACFARMGATADELRREEERLAEDAAYFDEWVRDLPQWCGGLATTRRASARPKREAKGRGLRGGRDEE